MLSIKQIKEYLVEEQGYDEEYLEELPFEELVDLYEMYHED